MLLFGGKQIGIDIADRTIEAVVSRNGGFFVQTHLPPGWIQDGQIKNKRELNVEIKKLFSDLGPQATKIKKVVMSVPKKHLYYHIFKFNGKWPKNQAEDLISEELRKHLPFSVENTIYRYRLLFRDKKRSVFLIVAAKKTVLQEWFDFFKDMGYSVVFDLAPQALHRVIKDPTVCLADLGKESSDVYLFFDNKFFYTFSTHIAGDYFTEKISQVSGLSIKEAEMEKIKEGLRNNEIRKVLDKEISLLVGEIEEMLHYAKEDFGLKIKKVALLGGTGKLKGLKDLLVVNKNFSILNKTINIKGVMDAKEYAEALGLSLKSNKRDFVFTAYDIKRSK